jgi:hypothetical protein
MFVATIYRIGSYNQWYALPSQGATYYEYTALFIQILLFISFIALLQTKLFRYYFLFL